MDLKEEIMRRVEALSPEAQRELLEQLERGVRVPIKGNTPEEMLALAGTLDDESAREMMAAIQAEFGCIENGDR